MPGLELQYFLATINELENSNDNKLSNLLKQMQQVLQTPHEVISMLELKTIINFLVNFRDQGEIAALPSRLREFDCFDIDKNTHGLARSLSIVRDLGNNEAILIMLTDRKYYLQNQLVPAKYAADNPLIILGAGADKSVKICLSIVFSCGNFHVDAVAKNSVEICNFVLENPDPKEHAQLSAALSAARSPQQTWRTLYKWQQLYPEICNDLLRLNEEVRISKALEGIAGIEQLAMGVPFLKSQKNGDLRLLVHVFSKKADGSLKKIQISKENLRYVIAQLLYGLAQLHERKIVHRDIKSDNILISINSDNPDIQFIDFGRTVDLNKLRCDTLRLLHRLGFAPQNAYGYVEGFLLDNISVSSALLFLEQNNIHPVAVSNTLALTLANINRRLARYADSIEIEFLRPYATLGYDAPEVFATIGDTWFKSFEDYQSLGKSVSNSLSDKAKKYINTHVSTKQDVWALGICIVFLVLRQIPDLRKAEHIAIIEGNELLSSMLHPDPLLRCSAQQAAEIYFKNPILIMPHSGEQQVYLENYINKIKQYNQRLEDLEFEFDYLSSQINCLIENIQIRLNSCEVKSVALYLQQLIMRAFKLPPLQKYIILIRALKRLLPMCGLLYRECDANPIDAVLLRILNSDIDLNHLDLAYITHKIISDGLSCCLIDALAPRFSLVISYMDLLLPYEGKYIWDVPFVSIGNIGDCKIAALARYIEKIVALRPDEFIKSFMSIKPDLFVESVAFFILDIRLSNALESATGKNMLMLIETSPKHLAYFANNDTLSKAIQYKQSLESQHGKTNAFISDYDLANMIMKPIKESNTYNAKYYLFILRCIAPHLMHLNDFALNFKAAVLDSTLRDDKSPDFQSLVQFLRESIPHLDEDSHNMLKTYSKDLLSDLYKIAAPLKLSYST
jgi:serine/threonine protein kinase